MPRRAQPLAERMADRTIVTDTCWIWAGPTERKGYGLITSTRRFGMRLAHRMAYELAYGPVPSGLCVCHRCDQPSCVRPDHLFLGTIAENNRDMAAKGRAARQTGERNGRARLTAAQAQEIRAADGTDKELAARYGVALTTVRDIRNGRSWRTAA